MSMHLSHVPICRCVYLHLSPKTVTERVGAHFHIQRRPPTRYANHVLILPVGITINGFRLRQCCCHPPTHILWRDIERSLIKCELSYYTIHTLAASKKYFEHVEQRLHKNSSHWRGIDTLKEGREGGGVMGAHNSVKIYFDFFWKGSTLTLGANSFLLE